MSAIFLVKDGFEFRFDRVALFLRHITQDIFHLVFDTTLPLGGGKLGCDRIEHRPLAIGDPQIHLFHAAIFEVIEELRPGGLILTVADAERQDFAHTVRTNADDRQNRHLRMNSIRAALRGYK